MLKPLQNKIALVTGASRGIGAATSYLLAERGARVVLMSRHLSELHQTHDKIKNKIEGAQILIQEGDVSHPEKVEEIFSDILKQWGPIDILVNNAAALELATLIETTPKLWDEIMAVNLRGPFLCSKQAFLQMIDSKRGGCIINLSSLGGLSGTSKFKGLSAYVVSKFGMVGLTESLAVEGRPYNIRVNCVAPGAVDTAMLQKAAPFLTQRTTPEEIAKVIAFLCDDQQSGSLTGAVIPVHSNE
ncbi:MAG: SDR family oxidoreductase [Deltaproteobacteria bacterium]|nr:SDR family oxidoreductase [Deltaproteobacteria bacterium]